MVALAYLNKMGGRVRVAERVHSFAIKNDLLLSAEWIPSRKSGRRRKQDRRGLLRQTVQPHGVLPDRKELRQAGGGPLRYGDNTQAPLYVPLKADWGRGSWMPSPAPFPASTRC